MLCSHLLPFLKDFWHQPTEDKTARFRLYSSQVRRIGKTTWTETRMEGAYGWDADCCEPFFENYSPAPNVVQFFAENQHSSGHTLFPSLQHIHLDYSEDIWGGRSYMPTSQLANLMITFFQPSLESLELSFWHAKSSNSRRPSFVEIFDNLLYSCPSLKALRLPRQSDPHPLFEQGLNSFLLRSCTLQSINLSGTFKLTTQAIHHLLQLTELEELDINFDWGDRLFGPEFYETSKTGSLPGIRRLCLEGSVSLWSSTVRKLHVALTLLVFSARTCDQVFKPPFKPQKDPGSPA
jgi:hypothetical protein